jgi:hypothetical protein
LFAMRNIIAIAWSALMRDLAAKIGISDVGLRKQFVRYGVYVPLKHTEIRYGPRKLSLPCQLQTLESPERLAT